MITYENMICNHICMNNYHRNCMIHLDIQHRIRILQLKEENKYIRQYIKALTYFYIDMIWAFCMYWNE
jgi:hypothetical protein